MEVNQLIWMAVFLQLLALLSLYPSCFKYSSPAFQADFTYGFTGTLPKDVNKEVQSKIQVGVPIEACRSLLCVIAFVLMVGWKYRIGSIKAFWQLVSSAPIYWSAIALISSLVTVVLIWYHFSEAPKRLAKNSKYWKDLKNKENFWSNCGRYWEEIYRSPNTRRLVDDPRKKEYYKMYQRPYRLYFLYAFIVYVCLLLPILAISVHSARSDCKNFIAYSSELETKLRDAETFDNHMNLIEGFGLAPILLNPMLNRFIWLVLAFSIVALFEALLGYRTLAKRAIAFAVSGYVSVLVLVGAIVIMPNILTYENLFEETQIKSTKFWYQGSIPQDHKEALETAIEELKRYSPGIIILAKENMGLGLRSLVGLFFLAYSVKKVFGRT